jgi:hypothetical protein
MKGNSHFTINDPIIVISTEGELVYCLAIVKSSELNIIGRKISFSSYQSWNIR